MRQTETKSEVRRVGAPHEIGPGWEDLMQFRVPLNRTPEERWLHHFQAEPDLSGLPNTQQAPVSGSSLIFECAEEDVFLRLKLIDERIRRVNAASKLSLGRYGKRD